MRHLSIALKKHASLPRKFEPDQMMRNLEVMRQTVRGFDFFFVPLPVVERKSDNLITFAAGKIKTDRRIHPSGKKTDRFFHGT